MMNLILYLMVESTRKLLKTNNHNFLKHNVILLKTIHWRNPPLEEKKSSFVFVNDVIILCVHMSGLTVRSSLPFKVLSEATYSWTEINKSWKLYASSIKNKESRSMTILCSMAKTDTGRLFVNKNNIAVIVTI